MLRTEADVVRSLAGTFTVDELYRMAEAAGVVDRDDGHAIVQDGHTRWKRRVRNALQALKASGHAERVGQGTWVINGTRERPTGAVFVVLGDPSEIELVLGDAAETLRRCDEPVDLVLVDPPWGLQRQSDNDSVRDRYERIYERDADMVVGGYVDVDDAEYEDFTHRWVEAAAAVIRPGGYLAAVTGTRQGAWVQVAAEQAGLTFMNQIVVARPFPLRTTRKFAHSHFVVTVLHQGPFRTARRHFEIPDDLPKAASGGDYPLDVWTDIPAYGRAGLLRYDNALPPQLVRRVMRALTPGEWEALVADPFVGSGTTAAVALAERRRFYGGDVNPEALRFTVARLREEPVDLPARLPMPAQEAMFT